MPVIFIDELVGFEPFALPAYLSLWAYVSMPPILMRTPGQIIEYGFWIGGLCLVALGIFYIWPTAVPPANIDWAAYPGMAFLKGVDAAGNACPSLHVATAVFSGIILDRIFVTLGMGGGYRLFNGAWCLAIVYSTIATKQHVAVDVFAGGAFGCLCAPLALNKGLNFLRITRQN